MIFRAVPIIADNRIADVRAMDAQLICPTGQWLKLDQCAPLSSLENAQARFRFLAALHHPPFRSGLRIAPDRSANHQFIFRDATMDDRQITLLDEPALKLAR